MRRDPRAERLGQVDARPPAFDAADQRRRRGTDLRPRRVQGHPRDPAAGQPRLGRGELLQEDVGGREPLLRGAVLRDGPVQDADGRAGDPREGRLPVRAPRRADGEPLTRHAAEGRTRASAADVAGPPAPRRADDRPRPALEARGAGVHQGRPRRARRDDPALHARHERGGGPRRPHRAARPGGAVVPRAGRGREAPVRRRHARRGVLRRDGSHVRGRATGRRRVQGGVRRMTAIGATMRQELIGLGGIVERNVYLTKRYFLWDVAFMVWTIANTLTIVFIARSVGLSPAQENTLATRLLVGAVIWAFLGIIFEFVTETDAWERWEGTIEYTFMAPLSRSTHLFGMGAFAVLYGLIRATILFFVVAAFIGIHMPDANFASALALLAIASISFMGIGTMTAVLPLISPEKGAQLGFVMQGIMLVVSGVYYPVSVMPDWMQTVSKISPATYALRGDRAAIVSGAGMAWANVWPRFVIAAGAKPLALAIFRRGERYAKKHGKLKRSG